MKAMILAAGLGTRLRPLTNNCPKALVEVNGKPLLEIALQRLKLFGFEDIIINVHHFAEQILRFLEEKENFGLNISISDEREQILETGGGLQKAAPFFDDGAPFLLYNTDILTNLDLHAMYQSHVAQGALVTLAVRQRPTSRYFIFNEAGILSGWTNIKTGEIRLPRPSKGNLQMQAFSGIHIIDPKIFALMPAPGKFSIVDVYLAAAEQHPIYAYPHQENWWLDVGKKESLKEAEQMMKQMGGN